MRISVIGDCPSANVLRSYVEHKNVGYVSTDFMPSFTFILKEHDGAFITVDGVDSELERSVLNFTAELTTTPILLQRQGGIQSEKEIRIEIPKRDEDRSAVERGCLRALLKITGHDKRKVSWWRKLLN